MLAIFHNIIYKLKNKNKIIKSKVNSITNIYLNINIL